MVYGAAIPTGATVSISPKHSHVVDQLQVALAPFRLLTFRTPLWPRKYGRKRICVVCNSVNHTSRHYAGLSPETPAKWLMYRFSEVLLSAEPASRCQYP